MKSKGSAHGQRMFALAILGGALVATGAAAQDTEKLPPEAKLVRIEAQPATIVLKHPYDYRQIVLTGYLDSGERMDLTRMAQAEISSDLANISPRGLVRPKADGNGELKFTIAGQTVVVPIRVNGQKEKYPASFVRDIMPVLSKVGCNAGTCHGAQQGKNGFKLSLRGYDPLFDHQSLTESVPKMTLPT